MRHGAVAILAGVLLCLPTAALAQEPTPAATPTEAPGADRPTPTEPAAPADGQPTPAETAATDQATTAPATDEVERAPTAQATTTPAPTPTPPSTRAEPAPTGIGDAAATAPPQTGIGEAEEVECRGVVTATIVDLDGAPVDGALVSVGGHQLVGAGTVELPCGEVTASLLAAPEGYAPAGSTTRTVQVRATAPGGVRFEVDAVEVLGTQFQQADDTPAAPAPPADEPVDAAAPTAEAAPAELAATGREDAPALLLAAVVCGLLGVLLLRVTASPRPVPVRRA